MMGSDFRRLWLDITNQITRDNAITLAELRSALDREVRDAQIRRDMRNTAWFILSCDRLGLPR